MCDLDMDETSRAAALSIKLLHGFALEGFPHHGIGRAAKIGKEGIVSLLFALTRFHSGGADDFIALQAGRCERLTGHLQRSSRISIETLNNHPDYKYPVLAVRLVNETMERYDRVRQSLSAGKPSIRIAAADPVHGMVLNLSAVSDGDMDFVADRLLRAVDGV